MKYLLIALAMLSGSASAMTFEEYQAIPEDKICEQLPNYNDVRSWVETSGIPESARDDFAVGFLQNITDVCIKRLQFESKGLQYELKYGKKPGETK